MTVLPQLRAEVVRAVESPRRRVIRPGAGSLALAVAAAVALIVLIAPGSKEKPLPSVPTSELERDYGVLRRLQTGNDRSAIPYLRSRRPESGLRDETVRRVGPHLLLYADTAGGLCLDEPGGSGCWSLGEVRAGKLWQTAGHIAGVVPDGVASVDLRIRDYPDATAEVHDNVFELTTTTVNGGHPRDILGITWRDGEGRPVGP